MQVKIFNEEHYLSTVLDVHFQHIQITPLLFSFPSIFISGIKGALSPDGWWLSSENVWLYGGWWNWLNGIAGIINIFCMTGWWGVYTSKDKKDMLWPDMIWLYIVKFDEAPAT